MAGYRPKSLEELNSLYDKSINAKREIYKKASDLEVKSERYVPSVMDPTAQTTPEKTPEEAATEEISGLVGDFIKSFGAPVPIKKVRPASIAATPIKPVGSAKPVQATAPVQESASSAQAYAPAQPYPPVSEKPRLIRNNERNELFEDYKKVMDDEDEEEGSRFKKGRRKGKKLFEKRNAHITEEPEVKQEEKASEAAPEAAPADITYEITVPEAEAAEPEIPETLENIDAVIEKVLGKPLAHVEEQPEPEAEIVIQPEEEEEEAPEAQQTYYIQEEEVAEAQPEPEVIYAVEEAEAVETAEEIPEEAEELSEDEEIIETIIEVIEEAEPVEAVEVAEVSEEIEPIEEAEPYEAAEPEQVVAEYEASEYEAPEYEAPEYEAPEYEIPEVEESEVEAPVYEISEVEEPETEAYEAEASEYETPEVEAPEAEEAEAEIPVLSQETDDEDPEDDAFAYLAAMYRGEDDAEEYHDEHSAEYVINEQAEEAHGENEETEEDEHTEAKSRKPRAKKRFAVKNLLLVLLFLVLLLSTAISAIKAFSGINTDTLLLDKYYLYTADSTLAQAGINKGDLVVVSNEAIKEGDTFAYKKGAGEYGFAKLESILNEESIIADSDGQKSIVFKNTLRGVYFKSIPVIGSVAALIISQYLYVVGALLLIAILLVLIIVFAFRSKKEKAPKKSKKKDVVPELEDAQEDETNEEEKSPYDSVEDDFKYLIQEDGDDFDVYRRDYPEETDEDGLPVYQDDNYKYDPDEYVNN